jgi:hypothetical protein
MIRLMMDLKGMRESLDRAATEWTGTLSCAEGLAGLVFALLWPGVTLPWMLLLLSAVLGPPVPGNLSGLISLPQRWKSSKVDACHASDWFPHCAVTCCRCRTHSRP